MKKLLVTGMDFLPEWCADYIKSAELVCTSDVSEANLSAMVKDCEGLLYMQMMTYPITRKVIEAGKQLKFIQSAGVGYELINVQAATRRNVVVMNVPAVTTVSVAEHTAALILACTKNLIQVHQNIVAGYWRSGGFNIELRDKILGIIGFGRIGHEVAAVMKGFGMQLLVYDPFVKEPEIVALGGKKVDLPTLLRESDIVTLHAPLTNETMGLINAERLGMMKETAILVNTSRGELVDEKALHKALVDERIRCAGLDVYGQEPVDPKNPLLSLENIVLTPHMAVQTVDGVLRLMKQNGEQVEKALHGIYESVVNPEVLPNIGKRR